MPYPNELNDFQLGYISAFLDGEGFIALNKSIRNDKYKRSYFTVHIGFVNTNLNCLHYIKNVLGIGTISNKSVKNHHQPCYVLRIVKQRETLWLLETLYKYLIIKKEKANLLIPFLKSRLKCNPNSKANRYRKYNVVELNIHDEYKKLNSYKCKVV